VRGVYAASPLLDGFSPEGREEKPERGEGRSSAGEESKRLRPAMPDGVANGGEPRVSGGEGRARSEVANVDKFVVCTISIKVSKNAEILKVRGNLEKVYFLENFREARKRV
jgi:hypothetical protein